VVGVAGKSSGVAWVSALLLFLGGEVFFFLLPLLRTVVFVVTLLVVVPILIIVVPINIIVIGIILARLEVCMCVE
jgi:hypothetical protein